MVPAEGSEWNVIFGIWIEAILDNGRLDGCVLVYDLQYWQRDVRDTESPDLAWDVSFEQLPSFNGLVDGRKRRVKEKAIDVGILVGVFYWTKVF